MRIRVARVLKDAIYAALITSFWYVIYMRTGSSLVAFIAAATLAFVDGFVTAAAKDGF